MPVFKKDSTVQIVVNTSDDKWVISKGMTLAVSGTSAIYQNTAFNNDDIIIAGKIINDDPVFHAVMLDGIMNEVRVEKSGSIDAVKGIYAGASGIVGNFGTIRADEVGVEASGVGNRGTIRADTAVVIRGAFGGVTNGADSDIRGVQYAIYEDAGTEMVIKNSGVIEGGVAAIYSFSAGEMTLTNRGTIKGAVMMGDGNDAFINRGGKTGMSEIWGGAGDDVFQIDKVGIAIREAAGEGYDIVRTRVSHAMLDNFEQLVLEGGKAIEGFGNNEDNLIIDNNKAANVIKGFGGADRIDGGLGRNQLFGGAGDDIIYSGAGNETMSGESGADIFAFRNGGGKDVILDFTDLEDLIDLSSYNGINSAADLATRVSMSLADTVLTLDNGDVIRIKNFDMNDLQAGDFIF